MKLKGLFIGIDRYQSESINWLSSAKRDAIALHSLFSDNMKGDLVLLTDEDATRKNIEEEFVKLSSCQKEDVVFIIFSGHGSETHELATYDAELHDLKNTAIPLRDVEKWFAKIPAERIILVLDCCFSGGAGLNILKSKGSLKSATSTEKLLNRISGKGRLILTASSSTQIAYEHPIFKHGLLIHRLIEGLTGSCEISADKKISIYSLLDYTVTNVIKSAHQIGVEQDPSFRGTIDGVFDFPIFQHGEKYIENFPEVSSLLATSDINSLSSFGYTQEIIKKWSEEIPSLNQLQVDAINKFQALEGKHLVVSAPTSSGKTMIGELAAIKGALERKRAIFLMPLKALVNDKCKYFESLYGSYGFKIIRATGDSNDQVPNLIRGQYDICLMTYEKFTAIVLGFPNVLQQVSLIVVDEVQMIADSNRGINLEYILTLIKIRRKKNIEPQIIALSAVIGETNGFEKWIDAKLLKKTERPVPLLEGIISSDGDFRYIDSETNKEECESKFVSEEHRRGGSQNWIIPLVRKLVANNEQVIVFRETKGEARGSANYLAESLSLPSAQETIDLLPQGDPSVVSDGLRKCLKGGVAFHIADLDADERLIIEKKFREKDSEIRVIVATTTLAMGVNTPADSVIIAGLVHKGNPSKEYTVAEYKNIVGRAGRLGFSKKGHSYLLALNSKDEHNFWNDYVCGKPESLSSHFVSETNDPRSFIVRALVGSSRSPRGRLIEMSQGDIIDFLEYSFGAFQEKQEDSNWGWSDEAIREAFESLRNNGLVEYTEEGRYKLTKLGWLAGQGGIEVESVIRIKDLFHQLAPSEITDQVLIAATQITTELEQITIPINSRGAQKELSSWASKLENQDIPSQVIYRLKQSEDVKMVASRFKKIVGCLWWMTDTPLSEIEDTLMKHNRNSEFSGPLRATTTRTRDFIRAVSGIAEILYPSLELEERVNKIFIRLEFGIPSKLCEIAGCMGSSLSRADYQSLLHANLFEINALQESSDAVMLNALNGNTTKLNIIKFAIKDYGREWDSDFDIPPLPEYES